VSGEIQVEVVYALPAVQRLRPVKLPAGSTVRDAIERSGLLAECPEIDLAANKVGIFGKLTRLDAALRPRDRVEIYRPLHADPKEVRRRRAAEGKAMRKGGGDLPAED
jgi:putative ubiquitin-RnfH superfamily antitoxin RatB of RatAB toxin-antitoxin module